MESYEEGKEILRAVLDLLERHFSPNVEFVLHDLSLDYEHTLVDIRNGHVTGRKVGDTGDILGLMALSNQDGADCCNTMNYTEDGRILRASTKFFRNSRDEVVASIAITEDITEAVKYEQYLHKQNRLETMGEAMEVYRGDVNRMLDALSAAALLEVGKTPAAMTREDKLRVIDNLERHGAFLIKKSGQRICQALSISKFTLYNYLEMIHKDAGGPPAEAEETP